MVTISVILSVATLRSIVSVIWCSGIWYFIWGNGLFVPQTKLLDVYHSLSKTKIWYQTIKQINRLFEKQRCYTILLNAVIDNTGIMNSKHETPCLLVALAPSALTRQTNLKLRDDETLLKSVTLQIKYNIIIYFELSYKIITLSFNDKWQIGWNSYNLSETLLNINVVESVMIWAIWLITFLN